MRPTNTRLPKHRWCWVLAGLFWGLLVLPAPAHEPFDVSSRMTLFADRLELVSTLGREGMKQLLTSAGRSPTEIEESLQSLGPDRPSNHPTALAGRYIELLSAGAPIAARRVISVSEGAEIILTLTYPRPSSGELAVHAIFYQTIPGLRKGVLFIDDEATGPIDAALLSAARPRLTVVVPAAPAKDSPKQP